MSVSSINIKCQYQSVSIKYEYQVSSIKGQVSVSSIIISVEFKADDEKWIFIEWNVIKMDCWKKVEIENCEKKKTEYVKKMRRWKQMCPRAHNFFRIMKLNVVWILDCKNKRRMKVVDKNVGPVGEQFKGHA